MFWEGAGEVWICSGGRQAVMCSRVMQGTDHVLSPLVHQLLRLVPCKAFAIPAECISVCTDAFKIQGSANMSFTHLLVLQQH